MQSMFYRRFTVNPARRGLVNAAVFVAVLMAGLAFSPAAQAQFGASLSGTVVDSSGGGIPNASVTLTNEDTKVAVTRQSGSEGSYTFPSLPGGRYDLAVSASGFKASSVMGVAVAQDAPRGLNVTLSAGGASETVNVDATDQVTLQTQDGSVSSTLAAEQLQKVPAYGRDPYNFVRTAVGITGDGARAGNGTAVFLPNSVGPGGSNFGVAATENTVQISAAGQRITDNNYMIDGVSVNSLGYGGAAVVSPNIEAISSVQVISTSFSAEDGRNTGAQVKFVTKSGTNNIHGSVLFQYDEPGLNAYNKYGGVAGSGALPVRVSTKSRDYAASLGGPIFRDKFFGFASFEGVNQVIESFNNGFIETAQFRSAIASQRAGSVADRIVNAANGLPKVRNVLTQSCSFPVQQDFRYSVDPVTGAVTANANGPNHTCQAINGGLDVGSPVPLNANGGTGYAAFTSPTNPSVNYSNFNQIQIGNGLDGVPDIQYVQLDASQPSVARQFNGRLDYYLTPRDQLAGSAYVTKLFRVTPSDTTRPNQSLPFDPTNIATTFIYIHTFAPTLLNEFRSNYTLFAENGVYDAQQAGVNLGIPFIELQNSFYTQSNRIHFGANAGTTSPGIFAENQYEVRDTITKIQGPHTYRIGFEGRWEQNNNNLVGGGRPTFTFAGLWNFVNDRPIYEGVSANPATGGQPNASRHLDDHYYAGFFQHDWRAMPNLTLNMGLRYEYFEPIYNKGSQINYPILGSTPGRELVDTTLSPHNHLWNSFYKEFSPKFAFAFSPTRFNNKAVLRGGFAMAYNRLDDVLFDPSLEDGPGIYNFGICCATAPTDFGSPSVANNFTYQLGTSTAYNSYPVNPALKLPIGSNGLPVASANIQIEGYGALPNLPNPYSYLYSLEEQTDLGHQFVVSIGYQGSTGRHYSRLVNQNFISPTQVGTSSTPFFALYIAHNDSNQYYNGLNVHVSKQYSKTVSLEGTYTWSKSMDQVSNGDGADGFGNQSNPANNASELGPSDFDVKHRVVALGTYNLNYYHGDSKLLQAALNGWQANGIFTAHTGFPYTPTTTLIQGIPLTPTSNTIGQIRPQYFHGTTNFSCNNDNYRNGTTVNGQFGVQQQNGGSAPGIGRNSFRGPCYQDFDLGIAKEVHIRQLGEQTLFRFQAQAFNVFNKLNFSPYTFGTGPAVIDSSVDQSNNATRGTYQRGTGTFARPASASAGRVIEFNARLQF